MKYNVHKRNFFFLITTVFTIPCLLYWFLFDLFYSVPFINDLLFILDIDDFFDSELIMLPIFYGIPILVAVSIIYFAFYRKEVSIRISVGITLSWLISWLGTYKLDGWATKIIWDQKDYNIPLSVYFLRFIIFLFALGVLSVIVKLIISMVRYPKNLSKGENNEI